MKKLLFMGSLILFLGFSHSRGQNVPTYSIPSYDVTADGYADFREDYNLNRSSISEERRGVYVTVNTQTPGNQAQVWVYSIDRETVYGPYSVTVSSPFYHQIDDREWGVLMDTNGQITTDVWIE